MHTVFSRSQESAQGLAREFALPKATTEMKQAVEDPDTDVVIIGLPNDLHVEAVSLAASAGKAVLCTKPLGRTAAEAKQMLQAVESAGVFAGYLEASSIHPRH